MKTSDKLDLDAQEYASHRLRALAHPVRIEILELLAVNKQMTVTQIFHKLNVDQAVASLHLNILKNKRMVVSIRDGKSRKYSLNEPAIQLVLHAIETLSK